MPDSFAEKEEKLVSLRYQLSQLQKANADQSLHAAPAGSDFLGLRKGSKLRRTLKGHFGKIVSVQWGGDSREIISASQDGLLLLWNAQTTNKLQNFVLKSTYVMSVGIEQTRGNLVASGGLDNICTIVRRDNPQAQPGELASHDGLLSCCRFISEQQILTSSGDSTCLLWDIQSMKPISTMAEHHKDAAWISLQPNSAAGGGEGGGTGAPAETKVFASSSVDQTVKIWDLRTPDKSVMTFQGFFHSDVNCVEFMPSDPNCLAACSQRNKIQVLDMRTVNSLATFNYIPAGGVKPSAGDDVEVQEGADMEELGYGLTSLAWSRSGRLVFCGHSDGNLIGFDVLKSNEESPPVIHHSDGEHISCIGMSPNGDALCAGSWGATLKVYA